MLKHVRSLALLAAWILLVLTLPILKVDDSFHAATRNEEGKIGVNQDDCFHDYIISTDKDNPFILDVNVSYDPRLFFFNNSAGTYYNRVNLTANVTYFYYFGTSNLYLNNTLRSCLDNSTIFSLCSENVPPTSVIFTAPTTGTYELTFTFNFTYAINIPINGLFFYELPLISPGTEFMAPWCFSGLPEQWIQAYSIYLEANKTYVCSNVNFTRFFELQNQLYILSDTFEQIPSEIQNTDGGTYVIFMIVSHYIPQFFMISEKIDNNFALIVVIGVLIAILSLFAGLFIKKTYSART